MKRSRLFPLVLAAVFLQASFLPAQPSGAASYYEEGLKAMAGEDWFTAVEFFLECLALNGAHAEGTAALAECYYELGEYDQALLWVQRARSLARGNMRAAGLEAFTLIALGRLDAASEVISGVLAREPYNRDALFAAGELDIARGRSSDALLRYREAVRRYPDDRRLLISLALVSASLGDMENAGISMERAIAAHPGDYRAYYYAAWLESLGNRLPQAIAYAVSSLSYRPGYRPAVSLLASLRYRAGQFEEAARLAGEAIDADREDAGAWYLKGLSYMRMGRSYDAMGVLSGAVSVDAEDEFIRFVLEDLLIGATSLEESGTGKEDPRRAHWASWHFNRARNFRSANLNAEALFEYRRGLRLNPYARDRREYAELLRLAGYPARYFEELKFMQDLGLGDRALDDAVEAYDSLLQNALYRRWEVNPVVDAAKRHWKAAVFSVASQSSFYHADAGAVAASYIRELLVHDRNIQALDLELRQPSFSQAYRTARDAGADYFIVVSAAENERDLSVKGELYVGRTGSRAGVFNAYRTGGDRLRNAARGIAEQFASSLPFRASLIARRQSQCLIDKGRADGVETGGVYDVVKRGSPLVLGEGIGLSYTAEELVGSLTVENADEEVASGLLVRNGFFDRIGIGDEIILQNGRDENAPPPETGMNPELRALLRTLR
ncbi:MAG: tetratricopeptide repeat protein [Treponema sp.]|jgi:tetratricopeptide (TPR) repeat protein|nr:tetratricopeptide repeat protein [Treponema sp.]